MKTSELRKMISTIVEDEIRKLAPVIVEEFLTEKYLSTLMEKKMARVSRSPSGLQELMANDVEAEEEDRIPRPPQNDHEGVYQGKSIKTESRKVVNKLLSPDNPMAFIYEDVKPIKSDVFPSDLFQGAAPSRAAAVLSETQQQYGESGLPIDKIPGFADTMKKMMRGMDRAASSKSPVKQTESAEERRLADLRAKLDQQVVSTPKTA